MGRPSRPSVDDTNSRPRLSTFVDSTVMRDDRGAEAANAAGDTPSACRFIVTACDASVASTSAGAAPHRRDVAAAAVKLSGRLTFSESKGDRIARSSSARCVSRIS